MTSLTTRVFVPLALTFGMLGASVAVSTDTAAAARSGQVAAVVAVPQTAVPVATVQKVAVAKKRTPKRHLAMRWAKTQAGKRYCSPGGNSGTATRSCYDCSGIIGTAYRKQGGFGWFVGGTANFSRYKGSKLIKTSNPRWGDLAFYGSGHIELFGHWGKGRKTVTTFGAHNSRTPAGYATHSMSSSWKPTAFYRIVGAG